MKKINEQTKSFLLYGIEDVIKPKEIYKLDGAILFREHPKVCVNLQTDVR